ncbi:MAG: hypothetical protein PHS74_05460 [Lachnospiraceae bacterium]|nr:hypothetical protein [Lachnospiraceae bacterium]
MEILFTAFHSLRKHNYSLTGNTSLFMFPIYGMAVLLAPISRLLQRYCLFFRGIIYACGIFIIEYVTGTFLMHRNCCPWNYQRSRWNIHSVVRLDYFPFWILAGILYEKILHYFSQKFT